MLAASPIVSLKIGITREIYSLEFLVFPLQFYAHSLLLLNKLPLGNIVKWDNS